MSDKASPKRGIFPMYTFTRVQRVPQARLSDNPSTGRESPVDSALGDGDDRVPGSVAPDRQFEELQWTLADTRRENDTLRANTEQLESKYHTAQAEIARLRQAQNVSPPTSPLYSQHSAQVQRELDQCRKQIADLTAKLAETGSSAKADYSEQLQEKDNALAQLTQWYSQLMAEVETMRSERKTHHEALQQALLRAERAESHSPLMHAHLREKEKQLAELDRTCKQQAEHISGASHTLTEGAQSLARMKHALQAETERNAALQAQLDECRRLLQQKSLTETEAEARCMAKDAEIQHLHDLLMESRAELERQRDRDRQNAEALAAHQNKLIALETAARSAETRAADLERELERVSALLRQRSDQLESLQQDANARARDAARLSGTLQSKESEASRLQAQIDALSKKLRQTEDELREKDATFSALVPRGAKLEAELNQLKEELARRERQLQQERAEREQLYAQQRQDATSTQESLNRMRARIAELEQALTLKRDEAMKAYSDLKAVEGQLEVKAREVEQLSRQLREQGLQQAQLHQHLGEHEASRRELARLAGTLEGKEAEIQRLERQCAALTDALNEREHWGREMESQASLYRQRSEALQAELTELQRRYDSLDYEMRGQHKRYADELDRLQHDCGRLRAEAELAESALREKHAEMERREAMLRQTESERNADYLRRLEDLSKELQEEQARAREALRLQAVLAVQEAELKRQQDNIIALETSLASEQTQSRGLKATIAGLRDDLARAEAALRGAEARAQEKAEDAERSAALLLRRNEQIEQLQHLLQEANARGFEAAKLAGALESKETEVARLTQRVADLQAAQLANEAQLRERQGAVAALTIRVAKLEQELEKAKDEAERAQSQLQQESLRWEAMLSELRQDAAGSQLAARLREQLREADANLDSQRERATRAEAALRVATVQVEEKNKELELLRRQLNDAVLQQDALQHQLQAAAQHEREAGRLSGIVQAKTAELSRLQEQLAELQQAAKQSDRLLREREAQLQVEIARKEELQRDLEEALRRAQAAGDASAMRGLLESQTAELHALRAQLAQTESDLESSQTQLKATKVLAASQREEVLKLEALLRIAQQNVTEKDEAIAELNHTLQRRNEQLENLQQQWQDANARACEAARLAGAMEGKEAEALRLQQQVVDLNRKLREIEAELRAKESALATLAPRVAKLEAEMERAREDSQRYQQQLYKERLERDQLNSQSQQAAAFSQEGYARLREQLRAAEVEAEGLRNDCARLSADLKGAELQLGAKAKEAELLRRQLNDQAARQALLEQQLHANDASQRELARLAGVVDAKTVEASRLQEQLSASADAIAEKDRLLREAQAEANRLRVRVEQLQSELLALAEDNARLQQEGDSEHSRRSQEIARLNGLLDGKRSEISLLEERLANAAATIRELERLKDGDLSRLQIRIDELMAELSTQVEANGRLQSENALLQAQHREEVDRLQRECGRLIAELDGQSGLGDTVRRLQSDLLERERELQAERERREDLERLLEDSSGRAQEEDRLRREAMRWKGVADAQKVDLQSLQDRVAALQAELDTEQAQLRAAKASNRDALALAADRQRQAEAQARDLQEDVNRLNALLQQRSEQYEQLQQRLQDANARAREGARLEGALQSRESEVARLQQQVADQIKKLRELEATLREKEGQLSQATPRAARLEAEVERLRDELARKDKKILQDAADREQQQRQQSAAHQDALAKLRAQLRAAEEAAEMHRADAVAIGGELKTAQLQLEVRGKELELLNKQLQEQGSLLNSLQQRNAELEQLRRDLSNVSGALEAKNAEIARLDEQIAELSEELREKQWTIRDKEAEIGRLQASNEGLQREADSLHDRNLQLHGEMKAQIDEAVRLRNAVEELQNEIQTLQDDLSRSTAALREKERQLREKEAELAQLRWSVEEHQNESSRARYDTEAIHLRHTEELARLAALVDAKRGEVQRLEELLDGNAAASRERERALREKESELVRLEGRLEELQIENDRLRSDNNKLQQELDTYTLKAKESARSLDSQRGEVQKLESQLLQAAAEKREKDRQLREREAELQQALSRVDELTAEVNRLRQERAKLLQDSARDQQQRTEELLRSCGLLEGQLADLREQLANANSANERLQREKIADATEFQNRLLDLETEVGRLLEENNRLRQDLSNTRSHLEGEVEAWKGECDRLAIDLAEAVTLRKQQQEEISTLNDMLEVLQGQREQLTKQLQDEKNKRLDAEQKLDDLRQLEGEVWKLEQQVKDLSKRAREAEDKVFLLQEGKIDMQTSMDVLREEISLLEQQLRDKSKDNAALRGDLDQLRQQIEHLKAAKAALEDDLERLRREREVVPQVEEHVTVERQGMPARADLLRKVHSLYQQTGSTKKKMLHFREENENFSKTKSVNVRDLIKIYNSVVDDLDTSEKKSATIIRDYFTKSEKLSCGMSGEFLRPADGKLKPLQEKVIITTKITERPVSPHIGATRETNSPPTSPRRTRPSLSAGLSRSTTAPPRSSSPPLHTVPSYSSHGLSAQLQRFQSAHPNSVVQSDVRVGGSDTGDYDTGSEY